MESAARELAVSGQLVRLGTADAERAPRSRDVHAHDRTASTTSAADLMTLVMPDNDDDTPAMRAYRDRLVSAVGKYVDPDVGEDVRHWFEGTTDAEFRQQRLGRIRWQREALLATAEDLGRFAEAVARAESGDTSGGSAEEPAEEVRQ